jgi:predicted ATPase/DNA-binding SARP family transcriptional activator
MPQDPVSPFSIRVLGPLQVERGGVPLPRLRSRKGHWILALLTLRHPGELERAWLAGTLWPDSPPSQALANLRNSLRDLRRALGSEAWRLLSPEPRTLALDLCGAEVDLLRFDAAVARADSTSLQQAIALYRGPLLEECPEEWILLEREAREQGYLRALETLAGQALAAGDAETAACYLRRAVVVDPRRESAHRALMEALAAGGNAAAALEVYRDLRLRLHREMNLEPDAETRALYERLRAEVRGKASAREGSSKSTIGPALTLTPSLTRERSDCPPAAPPSPGRQRHNLPCPLSSFVGREPQIAELKRLLAGPSRLVTATGVGGCGKTRLALQVAGELAEEFADGVWLVELAALADAALTPQAVAAALGVREDPGRPLRQTLLSFLKPRQLLLVLDNCEHLVDVCAELATALLQACPRLRILATSREELGVTGEILYGVPPLSLPPHNPQTSTQLQSEAVRLFLERAAAAPAAFTLTDENAPWVAQICRELDGLPLAIELAAARVRVLPVEQIAARLDDRFGLLKGSRSALPRHQTLRALIDWSYDLLSEPERALLRRLSVFRGGWTLEAAEAVCSDFRFGIWDLGLASAPSALQETYSASYCATVLASEQSTDPSAIQNPKSKIQNEEVLAGLTSLVERSLVLYEPRDGAGRYRFLETVRQYSHERLLEAGEEASVRERHRDFFLQLAENAHEAVFTRPQPEWLDGLEREHDNLLAALEGCPDEELETALRLTSAMGWFWWNRGYWSEGRQWIEAVLARAQPAHRTPARAWALYGSARLASLQGDYMLSRDRLEESTALFRALGDRRGLVKVLLMQAHSADDEGDLPAARALWEESVALCRDLGDRLLLAGTLCDIALFLNSPDDARAARPFLEESLEIARQTGDRHTIAWALDRLARGVEMQGDRDTACDLWEQALALRRELNHRASLGWVLLPFGQLLLRQGEDRRALLLLEECLAIARELDYPNLKARTLCALATRSASRYEEALRLLGGSEGAGQPIEVIGALGRIARERGDYSQAARLFRRTLSMARDCGKCYGVAQSLEESAGLAARQEQWAHAARLLGAAEGICLGIGAAPPVAVRDEYERTISGARTALGEEPFAAAWAEGRAMPLEQVIASVLEEPAAATLLPANSGVDAAVRKS